MLRKRASSGMCSPIDFNKSAHAHSPIPASVRWEASKQLGTFRQEHLHRMCFKEGFI